MKPTLLILAAGMGSRYGGNKQVDQFGPSGETIMDYSIFDAARAGFGKVVFIIRDEHTQLFYDLYSKKLDGLIDYDLAIQGFETYVPKDLGKVNRTKPWGTGHAMLCAWKHTDTPFAVINADDFYGFEAFQIMAEFLKSNAEPSVHAMVGYQISNTLSENGSVSRGVCITDADSFLENVTERTKIYRDGSGQIVFEETEKLTPLAEDTVVSMNFWGFKTSVFVEAEQQFHAYAALNMDNPKAEFFIPLVMSNLINQSKGKCKVFSNQSPWFGVTYPEDKPSVQSEIMKLVEKGLYPVNLWSVA